MALAWVDVRLAVDTGMLVWVPKLVGNVSLLSDLWCERGTVLAQLISCVVPVLQVEVMCAAVVSL